jgi:two-component system cell cycle response regulator
MNSKILVVDDTPANLMVLRSMLEVNGFAVMTASSGPQALELLKTELPEAILLDVMMPEMSGIEVLQRIKNTPSMAHIPVILVTARTQDEDVLDGYQHGADYYITKPCTAKQLMYGLQMVMGKPSAEAKSGESDKVA